MAGLWYEPQRPSFFTAAGGEASLGEIYAAARDAAILVDNTFAARAAKEQAYRERNALIFDLSGEKLDNPYDRTPGAGSWDAAGVLELERQWRGRVAELAQRRPELAGQLMPATSMEDEALALSREAEERFTRLAGSRDGAGKWLALFAGGGIGMMRDPVQVGALGIGGGPGAGRTVAQRILMKAFSEAAVNAGIEIAVSPFVQSYRARAGLESGADVALRNAAFAGLLGGVLGAGGRGVAEMLARGGRAEGRALAAAIDEVPPDMRAEIEARLPEAAEALRDAMPPAARGALDHAETIGHLDASRPAAATPEAHDLAVTAAHRAISAPEDFAGFEPDPVQVSRVADELAGQAPAAAKAQSLMSFIAARGGIRDDKGELAAIGAGHLAKKGKGKDRRASLDAIREAAEEAGYIGRPGETQVTTVADLLDAIDAELRGAPVYTREDVAAGADAAADHEASRARAESLAHEIIRHAGPGVDDALVIEAAELAARDGLDAFDALESVFTRAETPASSGRAAEIPPGWSDAELEAASASRIMPEAKAGDPFDDPGHVPEGFEPETGPFGPVFDAAEFGGDWAAAVARLSELKAGEVRGMLTHPATGPIDVPWGFHNDSGTGAGLAHIIAKHPDVVGDLPQIIAAMEVTPARKGRANRIQLDTPDHHAVVRLDYDDVAKTWLITAFRKDESLRAEKSTPRSDGRQEGGSPSSQASNNIGASEDLDNVDGAVARLMEERAERDLLVPGEDGTIRMSELIDEIGKDEAMADAVRSCPI